MSERGEVGERSNAYPELHRSPKEWQGKTTLAIADAKGHVQLHGMDGETVSFEALLYRSQAHSDAQNKLSPMQTIDCADDKTLCLSLDWSTRRPTAEYGLQSRTNTRTS